MTISTLILLGLLAGTPGVLLATPLTAALVVLVKKLYVEDTLEEGSESYLDSGHFSASKALNFTEDGSIRRRG